LEKDILAAGHGLNHLKAVRFLCGLGPKSVQEILINRLKVPFAKNPETGEWDLALEGGHAYPRVLHCADYTGKAIMDVLLRAIEETSLITRLGNRTAIDLLTTQHQAAGSSYRYRLPNQCVGAYVFNEQARRVETMLADYTVLATGGVGQVYLHTTNSPDSIGSGLSMASRAGVRLENLEYIQFHPTALYQRSPSRFLVSEAVRGEGARLINAQGKRFMEGKHPKADLAPRDIVAQAIMEQMLQYDTECVYLDASNMPHNPAVRFPTIYKHCRDLGLDMRTDPIPVVPAAHYSCGGILTDQQGRTSLERLYSVGECSCTGLHGANRLASTSLLETLLFGHHAALDIARRVHKGRGLSTRLQRSIPDWQPLGHEHNDDPAFIAQDWATIRQTMWNYVGVTRTATRLRRAFDGLRDLSRHLHDFYKSTPTSKALIDLFHGCQAAYLIAIAAMLNTESLGCHHRVDAEKHPPAASILGKEF
jgi:L-aspartate oxidase